ncbi:MAG: hypothetical protein ACREPG_00205 [Candidatus Binatia bacterium]
MPDPREIVTPPEIKSEPVLDPVKCETCVYFRAFTAADRADLRMRLHGDGWCYAQPPQFGASADKLGGAVVQPIRPPTNAGDLCQHWRWRAEFAGDVSMGVAEALESIADGTAILAQYLRESVNVGRKGA